MIQNVANDVSSSVQGAGQAAGSWVNEAKDNTENFFNNEVKPNVENMTGSAANWVNQAKNNTENFFNNEVKPKVGNMTENAKDWVENQGMPAVKGAWNDTSNWFEQAGQAVGQEVNNGVNTVKQVV
ncbi:unnamed protein product, partial [Mesorhabditis spiculigera]